MFLNFKKKLNMIRGQGYLYLMLLPTFLAVTIFVYKPIMYWIIAFKDFKPGKSLFESQWAGLIYFKEFFEDSSDAFYVFKNTLSINLISIVINLVIAMVFALLLNEIMQKKVMSLIQTVSILPFFVSWVITYSFFQTFFSVNSGLVNLLLIKLGIITQGLNILGSDQWGKPMILIANLWKYLGYNAVIFLASIAGIDQQLYEAAEIDGANRMKKMRFITIPVLATTFLILLIMNSGWIFNSNFEQMYLFTNSTNRRSIEVFDIYVYRFGLKLGRFSYATAVGICKTVLSIAMLFIANTLSKKMSGKYII